MGIYTLNHSEGFFVISEAFELNLCFVPKQVKHSINGTQI